MASVLRRLPTGLAEVILVDGQSTDSTVDAARAARSDIRVVQQQGSGKGDALRCGFRACQGEIIVALDADGSTDGGEIPLFIAALECGADLVKGSRFSCGARSTDITSGRFLGNYCLTRLVNLVFGTHFSDLCYGYTAFWTRHLQVLAPDCQGFEVETQLSIRAHRAGLRISEVPSWEYPRLSGSSKLRALRDGWRVLRLIVRERLSPAVNPTAHRRSDSRESSREE